MADARFSAAAGRPSSEGTRGPTRGSAKTASHGFTDPFGDSRPGTRGSSTDGSQGLGGGLPRAFPGAGADADDADALGLSPEESQQLFDAFCVVEGGAEGFIPAELGALTAVLAALAVQGDEDAVKDMLGHMAEETRAEAAAPDGCISFASFARAMVAVKQGEGGWA